MSQNAGGATMHHDLNELVKDALESGAQFAAIVDTSKIDYREEF